MQKNISSAQLQPGSERKIVQNSWFCTFVINLTIFPTACLLSYHVTNLNPLMPIIEKIYNQTYFERYGVSMNSDTWMALLSLTMSMLLAGGFLGSVMFKFLLSFLTRNRVMLTLHGLSIVGSLIIALGVGLRGSYEAFIIGRFVAGLMTGLTLGILPVIVNELSVPHRRNFYGSVYGTSLSLGACFGPFIGWSKVLGSERLWVGVILLGILPSLVYMGFYYWIPETPLQTLKKDGPREAIKVIRRLRRGEESEFDVEMKALSGENKEEVNEQETGTANFKEVIKTPQFRRHFIGIVILYAYLMLSGVNNVLFYSDHVFRTAGLSEDVVTPASIGVLILGPVVSVIGVVFLNRGNEPKRLLLTGSCIMIIGTALMTASTATYERIPGMSIGAIVAMCVYYIGFAMINLSCFAITGLIVTERTQPVCTTVGGATLMFSSWLVGFISPYLQAWIGPYGFLVWMGFSIAITLYVVFYVPNVGGKSSDQIQQFYKDK